MLEAPVNPARVDGLSKLPKAKDGSTGSGPRTIKTLSQLSLVYLGKVVAHLSLEKRCSRLHLHVAVSYTTLLGYADVPRPGELSLFAVLDLEEISAAPGWMVPNRDLLSSSRCRPE
jgi:hypothetical protein